MKRTQQSEEETLMKDWKWLGEMKQYFVEGFPGGTTIFRGEEGKLRSKDDYDIELAIRRNPDLKLLL
jgi:hypothetical protein